MYDLNRRLLQKRVEMMSLLMILVLDGVTAMAYGVHLRQKLFGGGVSRDECYARRREKAQNADPCVFLLVVDLLSFSGDFCARDRNHWMDDLDETSAEAPPYCDKSCSDELLA